jgi:Ca2+-binding RTX toxin-like protein
MTQDHSLIEDLESRRLLSTSVQAFIDSNDRLTVIGSEGGESIQVSRPRGGDDVFVTVWTNSATPDMTWHFDDDDVDGLLLDGRGGNDSLWIRRQDAVHAATILGGTGNDFIVGAEGGEDIDGGAGHDALYAMGGAFNRLRGGDGNDLLGSGGGSDRLVGGAGNDTLRGFVLDFFPGGDELLGGDGDDMIIGADALSFPLEILDGGRGNDTLLGRGGDDMFRADDGSADTLDGGEGIDQAFHDPDLDDLNNVEFFF